jgi:alkylation response protein AidB-like acyl-CoA dehydrogenase
MLLARTDWDVPKHRGITYFAFPMRQPGVEVRPLKQMNGYASFNEVFIDEARVSHDDVVGEVGGGWGAAVTTLAHERGLAAFRVPVGSGGDPGSIGRCAREAMEEAAAYAKTYEWYPQRAGRPDLVAAHLEAYGRRDDAVLRQAAARLAAVERTARWNVQRARDANRAGKPPGPEGSLAKLCASEIARSSARIHGAVAGAHAMLAAPDGPPVIAEILVSTPGASIAGGTDEVQHNIVGERVLGLPKEPDVDRSIPFREVRTNQRGQRPEEPGQSVLA